jgi:anti-anti-sigma factor
MTAGTGPDGRPPVFSALVTVSGGRTVLRAAGDLDFTQVPLLARALARVAAVPGQALTVDVTGLGFLDVAGVRALTDADERLRGAGGAGLTVRGASGIVRRIFEIMQVTSLLEPDQAHGPATIR